MNLRVLTFNVWHGLDGNSSIQMGSLEPEGRKEKRLQLTLSLLRQGEFDLVFLQEMSPVPDLSRRFARELELNEIHHIDNGGIRIRHWGIPRLLYGGLTILAKPTLNLVDLGAVKLSGSKLGYASDWLCFQINEGRIALFGFLEKTPWGPTLICNVHVHHGIELTVALKAKINAMISSGEITDSEASRVFDFCYRARDRRLKELDELKRNLDIFTKNYAVKNIILAGDLNCSDESLEYRKIMSWGFVDASGGALGATWDAKINVENHKIDANFHFPWPLDTITEDENKKKILHEQFFANEFRQRRIDYIFCKGPLASALKSSNLFANTAGENGLFPSDHFGVVSEFSV